ncbi:MAG: methylmalonyl-CoA mutase subunit beta [Alphaproteobacteria bacterium]|nr:methylmalonyl-CoA mutase subunit beta [Alphaproteobacteria bacterium]
MASKDKNNGATKSEALLLADGFPAVSHAAWQELVARLLGGDGDEDRLSSRTYDDIAIKPLYTGDDWVSAGDPSGLPGKAPYTRGQRAAGVVAHGWDVRQLHTHPDRAVTNAAILTDLESGVRSIQLRFAQAGALADDSNTAALPDGIRVSCLDDLDEVLQGVDLLRTPVALAAGGAFIPAAAMLAALWERRGIDPKEAQGALNCDPIGALAATGTLYASLDRALTDLAGLVAAIGATHPRVVGVRAHGAVFHNAGASEAQEIACIAASGVAYLRALTDAGMPVERAVGQIMISASTDSNFLLSIAKIRALRRVWGRVAEACGVSEAVSSVQLQAETSERMMSRRDPYVNMLRTTVSCFAAAVAGADSITVLPFDTALRLPDGFSRRIARNTQLILQHESGLNRVIDPAGGAWAVESLTDALAQRAWLEFQSIERAGGIGAVLQDGSLAAAIDGVRNRRQDNITKSVDPITGVSAFPDLLETPIEAPPIDIAALRAADEPRLSRLSAQFEGEAGADAIGAARADGDLFRPMIELVSRGGTVDALMHALSEPDAAIAEILPTRRLGSEFEALRDASEAHGENAGALPRVFLAAIGTRAEFGERMTFAQNALAAGGLGVVAGAGGTDPALITAEFLKSGCSVCVICSSDALYASFAAALGKSLSAAGATGVFVAGEKASAGTKAIAGIDGYLEPGGNLLEFLTRLLERMGVMCR